MVRTASKLFRWSDFSLSLCPHSRVGIDRGGTSELNAFFSGYTQCLVASSLIIGLRY